nr:MAG TPA: hypothetical protein [Caudoviricetes sp.]
MIYKGVAVVGVSFVGVISSLTSISNASAILRSVSMVGLPFIVRESVTCLTPTIWANSVMLMPFSFATSFIRNISELLNYVAKV